jgi:hypothetical protein
VKPHWGSLCSNVNWTRATSPLRVGWAWTASCSPSQNMWSNPATLFAYSMHCIIAAVTKMHASRPRKDFTHPPPFRAYLSQQYSVASFAALRVLTCLHSPGLYCSCCNIVRFCCDLEACNLVTATTVESTGGQCDWNRNRRSAHAQWDHTLLPLRIPGGLLLARNSIK